MKRGRIASLEKRIECLEPDTDDTFPTRIVIRMIGCRYEGPPMLQRADGAIPSYFQCCNKLERGCDNCRYFDPTYSKERAQATT